MATDAASEGGAAGVIANSAPRHGSVTSSPARTMRTTELLPSLTQLFEQRPSVLEVGRLEALGEPAVNRLE